MANYCATTRSNYFKVKDAGAFTTWAKKSGLEVWNGRDKEKLFPDYFAIGSNEGDGGGWPRIRYDEASEDYVDFDFTAELAAHLAENQVAVLMEVGAEKLRYIVGRAIAVQPSGEAVAVDLMEIYDRAKEAFGAEAQITEAEY